MTLSKVLNFHHLYIRLPAIILAGWICWMELNSSVHNSGFFQRIESLLSDLRLKVSLAVEPPPKSDAKISIIDIDERSLLNEGQWPWSREKFGLLVNRLAELGVVVVIFDVSFPEPQTNPVEKIMPFVKDPARQEQLKEFSSFVDADSLFAARLQDTDVILGYFFHKEEEIRVGILPQAIKTLEPEQAKNLVSIEMNGYAANIKKLQEATLSAGFVTTFPDNDGIVRRSPLVIEHEGKLYASLSLSAAMAYLFVEDVGIETESVGNVETYRSLQVGELPAYTDAVGRVIIPYRGGAQTYPYISATDVLQQKVNKEELDGGIVFIGASAIGIADLRSTPVGPQYPGVEVHANILDSLLTGYFPYNPDWEPAFTFAAQIVLILFLIWILPRSGPVAMLAISVLVLLTVFISNFWFWQYQQLDLPLTGSFLIVASLMLLFVANGFLKENATKKHIKGMFDQYVPAAHIDRMINNPEEYGFAGDNRDMTVLFSDIRSFTTISENLSATELKLMLNTYFTPITKEIFDHEGTIDKYVGDMVMAFWGAPISDPLHPQHAVDAAINMLTITEQLKPMFLAQGLPEVNIGVGVNTGKMNVGDMGSTYRRSYTVLGDAVNLGSRLESITKFYGVKLLIGEGTFDRLEKDRYLIHLIDRIIVKGKEEAIRVYEPVCFMEDATEVQKDQVQGFSEAYQLYLNQDWGACEIRLRQLIDLYPERVLFQVYLDRIDTLKQQSLPENWDGTFRHTSK